MGREKDRKPSHGKTSLSPGDSQGEAQALAWEERQGAESQSVALEDKGTSMWRCLGDS